MALTAKQKIFAEEYLVDLNATRAYKTQLTQESRRMRQRPLPPPGC